jgi:hypothetical protein
MKTNLWPWLAVCGWLAACGRTPLDPQDARSSAVDAGPDSRPDVRPQPDTHSDPPPDTRLAPPPDTALDTSRPPDVGFDQKVDRISFEVTKTDLPPKTPPDAQPFDLRADFREVAPDLGFKADLARDLIPDTRTPPGDVVVRPDSACTLGNVQACTCDNGLNGTRLCLPSLLWSECGCGTDALMRVKNGMIGEWTGTATNPWTSPYQVLFTFDSYSHYSARSSGVSTSALYYGTDADSPLKHYSVDDMQSNGNARGTIDIFFDPNTVQDKLDNIALSADLNRLKFSFMHFDQYGPLQYDLVRLIP